jgi:2-oxoisovalerate dehydrogenase E2 component (dihydrolipoyl transacylase)
VSGDERSREEHLTQDERSREEHPTQQVQEFLVPDLGEGLEDATITSWQVAVGDEVELNQTLCTVETNKAEVEIPSPYAGRIVELGGGEGDTLTVGSLLVRIATQAESPQTASPEAKPSQTEPSQTEVKRKPVLVGYGADDEMDTSRRSTITPSDRPRAKPAVRKLAVELNVDLTRVAGSGPDGVITREDVLAAAGKSAPSPDMVAVRGVQAEMAHRMALSRREIPDAHAGVQVDCSGLMRLRDRMRDADEETPITPFVLTLRLLTIALRHHPNLNSTWVDTTDGPQIHLHSAVHLGFGVAAPRGLLVPVVSDAQDKTTRELAEVVARLIRDARAGTLKPSDLHGSTFTVSNFGALGLDEGVPVINYPEAAILGMGSLKQRPVVVDGKVVVRPTMSLTCAFDHRIVDGAQVAGFLCELRDLIESPELAVLDL